MKRVTVVLSILTAVFCFALSAQAELKDMNDGTVYDTDTQLSWLKNANTNGGMTWYQAVTWVATLNNGGGYAGFTNWRLPTTAEPDATCSLVDGSGQNYGYNCTGGELGHLYYISLGNPAYGPLTKRGPFTNLQVGTYWSGTEYSPIPAVAWGLSFLDGFQGYYGEDGTTYGWAVRPGARTAGGGGATPVGYNPQWLIITFVGLIIAGGFLLRRRTARA